MQHDESVRQQNLFMVRRRLAPLLGAPLILFSVVTGAHTGRVYARIRQQSEPSTRSVASPSIPTAAAHGVSGYDKHFGENLYAPSEAKAEFAGFLKPSDFPSAAYCARCHADVHSQWRQSAHANSFRTPWYIKNVNELGQTKGVAYTRHCESCHNPTALFTGALSAGSSVPRPGDADGISCMVCHSIRKVDSMRGIGSYTMGRPAVLLDAGGEPVPGLPSDAEILAHLDRHKAAVMRPAYQTPEFCGSCHKAAIPRMLNGYKWLRTFSTYDEWQQSSWSTETPLSFYTKPGRSTCQTCHMQPEQARDPAARKGTVASHRWLGANTAVPVQYEFDEQAKRVADFLKADQIELDIFGMTIEHNAKPGPNTSQPLVAPIDRSAFTVLPGDWVRVDVVVRNKGIGHTLVPELRDFYQSWLQLNAVDDAGKEIYSSGGVNSEHEIDPSARSYTLQIVGNTGARLDHHEVWKTYIRAYDATVLPGRSDVVRYRFQISPGTSGFTLSAALQYRRFNRTFTNWVFNDKPSAPDRFPTITMATAKLHLNAGLNQPTRTGPATEEEAMRWNNYGIGMLDRQQYSEAESAFERVVRELPAYERGYVNVGIAKYLRGRYAESLDWLDRAAKLQASDDRAEYYRGLCFRWKGDFGKAIETLAPVGERWPRFRQVHQELGYLLMQKKRFTEAKAQFETVLALDPDDPISHRWLGPTLAALGDRAGAIREATLAADTGNDPAAGWIAQKFWREHPVIASEAMPMHTHSEGNKYDDADINRVLQLQNPPSYIWVDHY